MRWSGALCALLLCLVTCLLVVAFRVRKLSLRAQAQRVQTATLFLEAERDGLRRQLFYHGRTEVLGGFGTDDPAGDPRR